MSFADTDIDHSFTNDEHKPSAEVIQQEIILRICFLAYPPGSQLKEAELAQEFGISRTPIRDAISRIKHLGLVETRNGVGTVVVALTNEKIADVYETRLQLAMLIGTGSNKPVTEKEISQAAKLLDQAISLQRSFTSKQYVELNHQLHILVTSLINNTLLASFWQQAYYQAASTWYQVSQLVEQEAASSLIQELQDLVAALERDDLGAVGLVQRIHIGYGYQRIKEHLFTKV